MTAIREFGWCEYCDERHAKDYMCRAEMDFREENGYGDLPSRRVRVVKHETNHLACCSLDDCRWEHLCDTAEKAWFMAEQHAIHSGHQSRVYTDTATDLERKP